jgi:hypothetical protein
MKTMALAIIAAVGVLLASSATVEAGGRCYGGGYGGYGYSNYGYGGGYGNYGHIHHNVNPYTATWGGGHLHYHDTSHFDYVPGGYVQHYDHFHYQPGGYIYHQTGHYDLHH